MTAEVLEAYSNALEAWGKVPKIPFKVDMDEKYMTYSCPVCGAHFARVSNGWGFKFDMPIFCCGSLMV